MSQFNLNLQSETDNNKPADLVDSISFKMVCANCMDFDATNNTCTIRFTINKDKSRTPMKRKPHQKGCEVLMWK